MPTESAGQITSLNQEDLAQGLSADCTNRGRNKSPDECASGT